MQLLAVPHSEFSQPDPTFIEVKRAASPVALDWRSLTWSKLRPFESVTDQYSDQGLTFYNATALSPSNPRFQSASDPLVLVPTGNRRSIKIVGQTALHQVRAKVRGAQTVTITALSTNGHRLAHRCSRTLAPGNGPLPEHLLMVSAAEIGAVVLYSSRPFTLEQLWMS